MKVGYVQFAPLFGDKKSNLEIIKCLVSSVQADMLVFPEMATTGYMFQEKKELLKLAEKVPNGFTCRQLHKVAKQTNTWIVIGLPEIENEEIFDTAVVISPEGFVAKHQKTHLFLKEFLFFKPGKTKPTLFQYENIKIGLGICYDYMFPEYWRNLAFQGADILCNTANFVYDYGLFMMRARAIENGVFTITANRIGEERGQVFKGGSEIVDHRGKVLVRGSMQEEVCIVDISPLQARNKKWNEFNDLFNDRRPLVY